MSKPPRTRARAALAITLIVLPLIITAVVKYLPALTGHHQKISSLAILHPRLIGPKEFGYLEDDVAQRLRAALAEVPGLVVRDLPPEEVAQLGRDLAQVARNVGTDALVVPTLTIDSGIVQLNLQVIEARTRRLVFNTPYQSSINNYPDMMRAAGAALKRAIL